MSTADRIVTTVFGIVLALTGATLGVLAVIRDSMTVPVLLLSLALVGVGGFFTSRSLMGELFTHARGLLAAWRGRGEP